MNEVSKIWEGWTPVHNAFVLHGVSDRGDEGCFEEPGSATHKNLNTSRLFANTTNTKEKRNTHTPPHAPRSHHTHLRHVHIRAKGPEEWAVPFVLTPDDPLDV